MSRRIIGAALVVGLGFAVLGPGTSQAQIVPGVYPRSYSLSCTGSLCSTATCTSSFPAALVGRLLLSSPNSGDGSVAVNADFGNIIIPSTATPFT
jgi:hypothetical protein